MVLASASLWSVMAVFGQTAFGQNRICQKKKKNEFGQVIFVTAFGQTAFGQNWCSVFFPSVCVVCSRFFLVGVFKIFGPPEGSFLPRERPLSPLAAPPLDRPSAGWPLRGAQKHHQNVPTFLGPKPSEPFGLPPFGPQLFWVGAPPDPPTTQPAHHPNNPPTTNTPQHPLPQKNGAPIKIG